MDTSTIIMIVLLAGFLFFRLMPVKGIRNISTGQLKNELGDKTKQYIDVRTPMEFKGRSIKGFKNIPVDQLSSKSTLLSKDKEVVVICQSGMRSTRAAKILKKQGFTKITNVRGGMSAWN
jgi:rhodanese-related sulfurtransferase